MRCRQWERKEKVEILFKDQAGNIVPQALSAVSGHYNEEEVIVLNLHDLTEQKRTEEILKMIAIRDELTGLYNRYILEMILEKEFKRSDRYNLPLSLILLDFR